MKKILQQLKLLTCFLFALFFLLSCNNQNKISINDDKLVVPTNTKKTFKLKKFKPVMKQTESITIQGFNTEMLTFSTSNSPEISDKNDIMQYFYDTGETVNIGSMQTTFVSSGSKLQKNNIIYITECVNENDTAINKIYKIDMENQKLNTLAEIKDRLPLSYMFDLDENHILYFCVAEKEAGKYHYYINKFNLNNNEMETIIESEFDKNKMSGKITPCVNTYNEKIYAYTLVDDKPSVEIYDVDGKFIEAVQLNLKAPLNSVFTINITDNMATLSTLSRDIVILKRDGNVWNEICYIPHSIELTPSHNNYNSDNIYFVDTSNKENLYVLNKTTKEFKKYVVEAENDNRAVQFYKCDKDGNLLVWTRDKDSITALNYYIIENSKLK